MKTGLCLAGGGARGAYQIGAIEALDKLGLLSRVSAYSGTSIGSVNACMIATLPIETVKDIWFKITPDLLRKTEGLFKKIINEKLEFKDTGIFNINELEGMLKNYLDVSKLKSKEVYVTLSLGGGLHEGILGLLKASYQHFIKKDSQVVYSDLREVEDSEMIVKQIIASCSIPIVFSPATIDGRQYYDGGVYDNVPVQPLVDAGCDEIFVIHLSRIGLFDASKYPNTVIHEIRPKINLGFRLNFDGNKSKRLFEQGYNDVLEYFSTITL